MSPAEAKSCTGRQIFVTPLLNVWDFDAVWEITAKSMFCSDLVRCLGGADILSLRTRHVVLQPASRQKQSIALSSRNREQEFAPYTLACIK
jgi:hypothetical protein